MTFFSHADADKLKQDILVKDAAIDELQQRLAASQRDLGDSRAVIAGYKALVENVINLLKG